ncbi:Rv3235 family protein [Actinoplanes sp. NPDC089786]|uniref:Rv3235 family protein n=1 Tax=Actinoplanes sp. NPDC089786 TaxID=3155185 RepID=UPI003448B0F3
MTTVEVAPHGPHPPLRVRPLPSCDPPYDDEIEPKRWDTANQLALDWPAPDRSRQPPPTPAAEHLARRVASARVASGTAGDAKLAVRLFVQMFVEVLNGYRPAGHLAKLTVPKEAAKVVSEAVSGTGRVSALRSGSSSSSTLRQRRPPNGGTALAIADHPPPSASGGNPSTRPNCVHPDGRGSPATTANGTTTSVGGIAHRERGHPADEEHQDGGVQRGGCTRPNSTDQDPRAAHRTSARSAATDQASQPTPRDAPTPGRPARGAQPARDAQVTGQGPSRSASVRRFARRPGAVGVLKFHFCEPRPGAVESTVLLLAGDRTCALALRMELQGRRWMAAALRLL